MIHFSLAANQGFINRDVIKKLQVQRKFNL